MNSKSGSMLYGMYIDAEPKLIVNFQKRADIW